MNNFRHISRAGAVLIAVSAALAAPAAAFEWPTFSAQRVDLPVAYRPTAFNKHGELAGFKLLDSQARWGQERLGWRQLANEAEPHVVQDLPKGDRHGAMLAINDAGMAAGFGTVAGDPDQGYLGLIAPNGARAVIVTPAGEAISLAPVLIDGTESVAVDVNRDGVVAGTVYTWWDEYPPHYTAKPFVWSAAGGVRYPFGSAPGRQQNRAVSINDHGQLAGMDQDGGYLWDPDKGVLRLPRLVGVAALNNRGEVTGRDVYRQAFVWQRAAGKRILPILRPSDKHRCNAYDINDSGWIVGVCNERPILWIPDESGTYQAAELNGLTQPTMAAGEHDAFTWSEAVRIADDGRILVHTWNKDRFSYESEPSISVMLTPWQAAGAASAQIR